MALRRRDFIRSSVIASLLAPVAMQFRDLAAAQPPEGPTYMVLIFIGNGKCRENVFVETTADGFRFGPGFAPLERHKADAIAFQNYHFQSFINRHYSGDHGGHVAPGAVMFTGDLPYVRGTEGGPGIAPSIDQIVAYDYLRRGVIADPLRKSLNIKMTGSSFRSPSVFLQTPADYSLNATFTSERTPVSQLMDPREGFSRMFGDFAAMAGSTTEQLWAVGRSVLDVPHRELARMRTRLPAEGLRILDQHEHSLRELETSFASEGMMTPLTPPDAPPAIDVVPANHVRIFEQWARLIDASFRFDRTRIATIQFGGIASRFQVPELGLGFVGTSGDSNSGSDHHSYTHHQPRDVDRFLTWYSERIAGLLDTMKGDGTAVRPSILPQSAVMVGAEFGWNHDATDVPVMLFGQGGGYFRTGQLVTYGNDISQYHKHTGTLLSVCHAMGVTELTRIGRPDAEYQRGVVEALRA